MSLLQSLKNKLSRRSKPPTPSATPSSSSSSPQVHGRMKWPPTLREQPTILGEIREPSLKTPRDIGRSITLGSSHYYLFGDTFCFDKKSDFVGVANNSLASIPHPANPTRSQYLDAGPLQPNFVPHTEAEAKFTLDHKEENWRICLWPFGGVVEDQEGCGAGWLFFDKIETHGAEAAKIYGVGVARVKRETDGRVVCERVKGEHMVFGDNEPAFGSITAFKDQDGYVYCFGGYKQEHGKALARIRHDADFSERTNYQFYGKGGKWVSEFQGWEDLEDVLWGQQQGAIVYLPDVAPAGKPYLWFGVNMFMVSHIYVAAAEKIEGPWDVQDLGEAPKVEESSGHRYCCYPHIWASDPNKGEIVLSWSDDGQLGGKVVAGRFKFDLE